MFRNVARTLAVLSSLAACHAPAPPAPKPPSPPRTAEPPPSAPPARPPLERFFEALATATGDVRIVEIGDSHTAADWQTGPVRRQLQSRFGDGGRGFVPIGRPWKAWSQEGVLTGTAGEWSTQMNNPASRRSVPPTRRSVPPTRRSVPPTRRSVPPTRRSNDGVFGLAGFALSTRQPGARAWDEILAAASSGELDYLEQPGGGSFDLVVDGAVTHVSTRADSQRAAYRAFDLAPGQSVHHIEVRARGDGEVRVFGVALDRSDNGIVYDALGINGARVATALSWSEGAWVEELRHRAPALVVVAYGSNDAVDVETSLDVFERSLAELLGRIARAVPSASCLVLGPPDRANAPRLADTIARERRVAAQTGCGFFDRAAAMDGGIARWGGPDHVHLTRDGYAHVATAFVNDLVQSYEAWRAVSGK